MYVDTPNVTKVLLCWPALAMLKRTSDAFFQSDPLTGWWFPEDPCDELRPRWETNTHYRSQTHRERPVWSGLIRSSNWIHIQPAEIKENQRQIAQLHSLTFLFIIFAVCLALFSQGLDSWDRNPSSSTARCGRTFCTEWRRLVMQPGKGKLQAFDMAFDEHITLRNHMLLILVLRCQQHR